METSLTSEVAKIDLIYPISYSLFGPRFLNTVSHVATERETTLNPDNYPIMPAQNLDTDLDTLIDRYLESKRIQREAQETIDGAEETVKRILAVLMPLCQPVCLTAVEEHNTTAKLWIAPDEVFISFDRSIFNANVINISVGRLNYRNGDEPIQDLNTADIEVLLAAPLRPILNSLFKKKGLPFILGEIIVPAEYYEK